MLSLQTLIHYFRFYFGNIYLFILNLFYYRNILQAFQRGIVHLTLGKFLLNNYHYEIKPDKAAYQKNILIMDDFIINILNTLAQNASILSKFMLLIVGNYLLKGGVIMAVLWYLWFKENSLNTHNREKIILTLYSIIIAIILGRGLQNFLPYRARPILNPEFNFPYQLYCQDTWSSFPSDHAMIFFGLATGIFRVSKKWGLFSYTYALVIICLPRIYLGFHYPTDVLAGAAIGIFLIWVISFLKISRRLEKKTIALSIKYPGIFYACLFILSYQIATLFDDSRDLVEALYHFFFK